MKNTRAHKKVTPKRVLRRSRIAQAVCQTLRRPHRPWRSMAGLAAAGMLAMSTPTLAAFPPEINLSELDGSNGFVINGVDADDISGRPVSDAGDVNGDGIDDVIIGASAADPNGMSRAGEAYVVFGRTTGFPSSTNLADLDGNTGFVINGASQDDRVGNSVSSAGDINGDGIDDVIIGAYLAEYNGIANAGKSHVVFGRTTGFPAALNVSDLDGSNGFTMTRGVRGGLGGNVSDAGDVNGDGIDDVIFSGSYDRGLPHDDLDGLGYVVFGRTTGFPALLNVAELDGSNGFNFIGDLPGLREMRGAGDVNGDGIDDMIIENDDTDRVESRVMFGRATGFPALVSLTALNGNNGFVITGLPLEEDEYGVSASGAGDVNGDGIDDVIIGAQYARPNDSPTGGSYVVFGRTTSFPAVLNLSELDGSNGFAINGIDEWERSGSSVSSAGDVNSDGTDDVIIGAWGGLDFSGRSYLVFGRSTGFPAALNLSELDGRNGSVINGIDASDYSGSSVSNAGDINGDGIDDVIIGAYSADPNGLSRAGESYVVFGRSDLIPINIDIKPGNDRNVMNPRSRGSLWVATLSDTESPFDPSSQVDIPTVEFGPDGAKANRHKVKDINKDGLGDLLLRFKIPETGIACGDTEATLTGEIFEGQSFAGTDDIKTVGCKPKKCHKKHHDDDRDDDKKHNGKHKEKKYHNKDHDNDHKKR